MRMTKEEMENLINRLKGLDYDCELVYSSIDSPSKGIASEKSTNCRISIMAHMTRLGYLKEAIEGYLTTVKENFVDADERGA